MPCYAPVPAYRTTTGVSFAQLRRDDHVGSIDLPCGQCIGCRLRRASDWTLRVVHEKQLHRASCFLTLTYDDDHLPPHASLRYSDVQLFLKRLRRHARVPIRFYLCGEYGGTTARPHYHACLFGYEFPDRVRAGASHSGEATFQSATVSRLWPLGFHTVQDLTQASAAYTARYVTDKLTGQLGAEFYGPRTPPFNRMSLRPGIGARWFDRFASDVTTSDQVIDKTGKRKRPPRYYDKLRVRLDQGAFEDAQYSRTVKAREHLEDNTPARLAVRAEVEKARLRFYKREL